MPKDEIAVLIEFLIILILNFKKLYSLIKVVE